MDNNTDKKSVRSQKISFKTSLIITALAFGLGFAVAKFNPVFGIGGFELGAKTQKAAIDTAKLNQVQDILLKKYDGEIEKNKETEGAITGLVASLGDPYTVYMNQESSKELNNELKGELSGIGIEVGIKNNRLTVIAPIDGTPAAKAGLRSGDIIALIDEVDSSTLTLDEAVNKIRGKKDTTVKLTIVRGSQTPKELTITRDNITVSSVTSEMKEGDIGYIKIRRFGDDTIEATRTAAADLKNKGARAVVVDLRDNPGGYLEGAVKVTSEFMASGVVVEERSKFIKTGEKQEAVRGGLMTEIPVVLLINGGSASASEIMAGALKDNGRAVLVGEKSYGKGSVQEVVELSDGNSLKITVAHWYTPKGVNISKEGIKPDVEIKNSPEDYNSGADPQLQKALETAKSKIK